ncbi:ATP-binding protein [Umezawaea sp.]|uniref:ATP-binding protein n=1 Tax=Umezawaea sp. TaxID=1955258 RepID=UPI002ECFF940
MNHRHGTDRSFDLDGSPLVTGSVADATAQLHAEVERALTLGLVPWECPLEDRVDLAAVRVGIRGHLGAVLTSAVLEDVVLVAVELVTNAVQHAKFPRRLRISRRAGAVRVDVTDGTSFRPVLRAPSPTRANGRGILIVHKLSRAWGVLPGVGGGKTVWAELAERP